MVGVEIDFVVADCKQALALYASIFDVEIIEATDLEVGTNEAVFTIYGVRFHILDENLDYQLIAPRPGHAQSMWLNIIVADINETYDKAIAAGCSEIQPVTEIEELGVSNAFFSDPFGYIWMLHQTLREVSFEERVSMFEDGSK